MEPEDERSCFKRLAPGYDVASALMNLQQLWLPTQDWVCEYPNTVTVKPCQVPSLPKDELVVNDYQVRGILFFLILWCK